MREMIMMEGMEMETEATITDSMLFVAGLVRWSLGIDYIYIPIILQNQNISDNSDLPLSANNLNPADYISPLLWLLSYPHKQTKL